MNVTRSFKRGCTSVIQVKLKILAKIIISMKMCISHLGPADITGHDSEVQYSVIVPYSMLIWLKKSTARNKEKQLCLNFNGEICDLKTCKMQKILLYW